MDFLLHLLQSRTNSNLASLLAAASLNVFVASVLATPFFQIAHTLLVAPESTDISTISCTTSIAFTPSTSSPRSVKFRHFVRILLSFVCLSLRSLNPSRCSSRILLNSLR